jgi:hypothetical protein
MSRLSTISRRVTPPANNPAGPTRETVLSEAPTKNSMHRLLLSVLDDAADNVRAKVLTLYGFLLALNFGAWIWAVVAFRHFPVLLGTAFLAYSFGLRHAVDADHIAAIDNVTRKLMQEGKRPVAVGFMFSLGHSTIVVLGSATIAGAALSLQHHVESAKQLGGVIGTLVSSLFLFGIAIVNAFVLRSIYLAFRRVRRGDGRYHALAIAANRSTAILAARKSRRHHPRRFWARTPSLAGISCGCSAGRPRVVCGRWTDGVPHARLFAALPEIGSGNDWRKPGAVCAASF